MWHGSSRHEEEIMDLKIKDKNALVLGASQGIGRAVAQSLIAEGANVTIVSRSEDKLKAVANEIGATGYLTCDLTKKNAARDMVNDYIQKNGNIDILVINTGGPQKNDFLDVSVQQWENDFQSLWISSVEALQAAIPSMQEGKFGRVIFVTSIAAKEPLPGLTTSNGIRAGIPGLCRSMANEFSKDGITFNCLLPGYTNTERIQNLNMSEDKIKEMVPAGRLGDPSELADLATFLCSERAGYVTAQSIAVDGGVLKGL